MSRDHSQNHYGPNASFDGHDSDLAAAGILIESLRQQLAAALAACRLKDEALQNCEGMLDELRDYPITHDAIIEALAIQPDDSALKAWLGEPVAWNYELGNIAFCRMVADGIDRDVPLYSPKGLFLAITIKPGDDSALKAWLGEPLLCREDGRCQYAIDHGAEGMAHCPEGKCCMPRYSPKGLVEK